MAAAGAASGELQVTRLGAGPRLVALHGGPGLDHHLLLPLARRLATTFEVWLPDLPGHGGSRSPSGRPPGLTALVERTAAWMRSSGAPDVLLGHSLGAFLARDLVRLGKVRPRVLVLVSPPAGGQPAAATALGRRLDLAAASGTCREAARDLLAHLAAECGGEIPAEIEAAARRVAVRPVGEYRALLHNLHRRLAAPLRPCEPGCPTIVLCGEEDRTTPLEQASRVAAATAGAHLETVPGAGHYPWAGREDAVAARLIELLVPRLPPAPELPRREPPRPAGGR